MSCHATLIHTPSSKVLPDFSISQTVFSLYTELRVYISYASQYDLSTMI